MKKYYCWRCKILMPFLDEYEWNEIYPLFRKPFSMFDEEYEIKTKNHNLKISLKFEELTKMKGVDPYIIGHHRLSDWGEECVKCNNLLRTPKSKFCADCGFNP